VWRTPRESRLHVGEGILVVSTGRRLALELPGHEVEERAPISRTVIVSSFAEPDTDPVFRSEEPVDLACRCDGLVCAPGGGPQVVQAIGGRLT